jgi:hypothetical protein
MKKTLTGAVALLAGAFVAHSQGTVSLANYAVLNTYIYVTFNGTKLGGAQGTASGNPATDVGKGNNWTVALYGDVGASDAASALSECTVAGGGFATATFATGTGNDKFAGTWYSGVVAQIPGTVSSGQAATLQLYAWYNNGGTVTSYSAATVKGVSALENLTSTGGPPPGGGPSGTAPDMPSFPTFAVTATVPEPSTIALGVMGASGMLLRLRRKK